MNFKQGQELMDNIIRVGRIGRFSEGFDYCEKKETKMEVKYYEEKADQTKKLIESLLQEKEKEIFWELINDLENIEVIKCENSFNNGVRCGLNELNFLREYFEII